MGVISVEYDSCITNKVLVFYTAVLHFQLKEIPKDFFVDIVSRKNFLTTTLQVSDLICILKLSVGSFLDKKHVLLIIIPLLTYTIAF